ncbi:MAG: sodium:proton antiporter NhaD [Epsilonproteobacteria bacterium]|nr:sodium:proton antiporter NhaD [Campylobacterota bacterium]
MELDGIDLSTHPFGWMLLLIFFIGYYFIVREDKYHLDKSKPALFIGTFMFILIGGFYAFYGLNFIPFKREITQLVYEIAEIFFFLFVAMTFIEALIERGVFNALKGKLIAKGYSYRELFWITGFLAFFISPMAGNLATALILSTVLVTIERKNKAFLVPGAMNVVVAANAGGVWSPFGDITTLMAWTAHKANFADFLYLFPAAFIGWMVTAYLLVRYVPNLDPNNESDPKVAEKIEILKGGKVIVGIGIATIAISVIAKQVMQLPPMWGMLFGLSVLQLYTYRLKRRHKQDVNIYKSISKVENNTLLFFFGILAAVGALYFAGFLGYVSKLYDMYDPTYINIGVGFISAAINNVPVMSAVLKAKPAIDYAQWMLLTLSAGVGGSLISFGSAAGVGVMSKLHGIYTFSSHIKLAWTVLIGYMVSIAVWYFQFMVLGVY